MLTKKQYHIIILWRTIVTSLYFGVGEMQDTPWVVSAIAAIFFTVIEIAYGERLVAWALNKTRKN